MQHLYVDILTLIVLFLTLIVVCWYTRETYHLRVAAQRQIQTSILPIVVLNFEGTFSEKRDAYGQGGVPFPALRNIGFGPAFEVKLSDLKNGEHRVQFCQIPLIETQEKADRLFPDELFQEGESVNRMMSDLFKLLTDRTEKKGDVITLPVKVTFKDANGKHLESHYSVECDRQNSLLTTRYGGSGM